MIQANELRIGNYFRWSEFASMGIGIDIIRKGSDIDSYNQLKNPILLTEDILLNCGFELEIRGKEEDFDDPERVYFLNGIDIYDHREDGGGFTYATYTRYPGRGFKAGCNVETLHQLQNLYFALTGTELNYNPSIKEI